MLDQDFNHIVSKKEEMHNQLHYMICHVFLPPKLPQKNDHDGETDIALIREVKDAMAVFMTLIPIEQVQHWKPCVKMLSSMMVSYNAQGALEPQMVEDQLQQMGDGGM